MSNEGRKPELREYMRDFETHPLSRREIIKLSNLAFSAGFLPRSLRRFEFYNLPPLPDVADPLLVRIVNETHPISQQTVDTQVVPRLVAIADFSTTVPVLNTQTQIHELVIGALYDLVTSCNAKNNMLTVRSGFRSIPSQQIALDKVSGDTRLVALPGTSQHHTGLAIDFTCPSVKREISATFGQTTEYSWLAKEAYRYGFVQTYESTTPIHEVESWHWVFIGIPQAIHFQTLKQRGFSGDVFAYQALYAPKSEQLKKRR